MTSAPGIPYEDFTRAWAETCGERLMGTIPDIPENLLRIMRGMGMAPDEARIAEAVRVREDFVRTRLAPRPEAIGVPLMPH